MRDGMTIAGPSEHASTLFWLFIAVIVLVLFVVFGIPMLEDAG